MLSTEWQKSTRESLKHRKRMESIYAKRDDICLNCAFFKDGRFCVNPVHAEGNCWTESHHVVGSIQVAATQGCELFEKRREIEIREPDPDEAAERQRHDRERRARWDAETAGHKAERDRLISSVSSRFGHINGLRDMDTDALRRLAQTS